jgi:hypothetical protein
MNKKLAKLRIVITMFVFAVALIQPLSASRAHAPVNAEAAPSLTVLSMPDDPVATYQGARIVHNVTVKGKKGMRVHAKFTVKHGLDVACTMIAYFYYDDADNTPLTAGNPNYRTRDGNVSAQTAFTPAYDPAVYNDLQIFIPYDALNMDSGESDLKFYLALYDKEGERFFGKSGWYKFQLTMP